MSKFISYSWLVLSFATVSHLGHVVRLHLWHCALIFTGYRHIFLILLEYLCPHASSLQLHNLSQLIQYPYQSSFVSLNLEFSCCKSSKNCNSLNFFFFLYTLSSFHSNFLISFLHFLSYSNFFLFNNVSCFFCALNTSFSYSCSFKLLNFVFLSANFMSSDHSNSLYFFSHFWVIVSLVFFIYKKSRSVIKTTR